MTFFIMKIEQFHSKTGQFRHFFEVENVGNSSNSSRQYSVNQGIVHNNEWRTIRSMRIYRWIFYRQIRIHCKTSSFLINITQHKWVRIKFVRREKLSGNVPGNVYTAWKFSGILAYFGSENISHHSLR